MVETGSVNVSGSQAATAHCGGGRYSRHDVMNFIRLSLICSLVIGIALAIFLRIVKLFNKSYEEFEDERHRAVVGTLKGKKLSEKNQQ